MGWGIVVGWGILVGWAKAMEVVVVLGNFTLLCLLIAVFLLLLHNELVFVVISRCQSTNPKVTYLKTHHKIVYLNTCYD